MGQATPARMSDGECTIRLASSALSVVANFLATFLGEWDPVGRVYCKILPWSSVQCLKINEPC